MAMHDHLFIVINRPSFIVTAHGGSICFLLCINFIYRLTIYEFMFHDLCIHLIRIEDCNIYIIEYTILKDFEILH